MSSEDELNFELDDLLNLKDEEQLVKEYLTGSVNRAKIFLWCCKVNNTITVEEVVKFFREIKSRDQVRGYMDGLTDHNLLIKSKIDHKKFKYVLNKNGYYYKKFIPIAKEVLGIK